MLIVWVTPLAGQEIRVNDSSRVRLFLGRHCCQDSSTLTTYRVQSEYSLNASLYSYLNQTDPSHRGNFLLFHSLRCLWRAGIAEPAHFSGSFVHRLGIQYFFDSLASVSVDENILRARLELRIRRWLGYALDSDLSTAILNSYLCGPDDSGKMVRILRTAFLTPMIWNFSTGFTFSIPETVSLLLGISGGKFTLVRDQRVYEGLAIPVFYGVPQGRSSRFEYGMSIKLLLDRTFNRFFRWSGDLLVFKNFHRPCDLNLRNSFEFRLARYFLLSLQTRVIYESAVSSHCRIENLVSAGFSVRF